MSGRLRSTAASSSAVVLFTRDVRVHDHAGLSEASRCSERVTRRVLSPIAQARRFDPDGGYVRRYVTELASVAGAAVHEPWKLPRTSRRRRYPGPIVEPGAGRRRSARDAARA